MPMFYPAAGSVSDNELKILKSVMPLRDTLVPVMTEKPVVTLTKGTGMASVSITTGGNGYAEGDRLTIDDGNSIFAARIRVMAVNETGVITSVIVQTPGVYETPPVSPVSVSGGSGSGATFTVTWNPGITTTISNVVQHSRLNESEFEYTGYDPKDSSPGYRGNGIQNGTQMVIEFYSDSDLIEFRLVGGNYQGDLYVNDQRISSQQIKTDTSGAPYLYIVDWQGVRAIRKYRLCGINTGFGGINTEAWCSVWRPDLVRKILAWQLGDSYTVGVGATQGSFNGFRIMCDALGIDGIADGISGAGWTSIQDGKRPPERVEMKLSSITRKPDLVFFSMGYNDAGANNLELLRRNFRASVNVVRTHCPRAKIINIGPATPIGSTTNLNLIRGALIELCEELNITFIDVNNWVNSGNKQLYTSKDNVHPTDAGYAYIGIRIAQEISRYL
ncbi:SGNH/GDSL hydrolase family protein [Salmonella enterica subsp. salamae]|nr:SGNH/GDSL hydrolase family protein [Salmonella enterica subsp. salamae]SQH39511.1 GDSL-like Lipase/Acylhydrolase [Salmonella enterica]